jgi:hypothetical protein
LFCIIFWGYCTVEFIVHPVDRWLCILNYKLVSPTELCSRALCHLPKVGLWAWLSSCWVCGVYLYLLSMWCLFISNLVSNSELELCQ